MYVLNTEIIALAGKQSAQAVGRMYAKGGLLYVMVILLYVMVILLYVMVTFLYAPAAGLVFLEFLFV